MAEEIVHVLCTEGCGVADPVRALARAQEDLGYRVVVRSVLGGVGPGFPGSSAAWPPQGSWLLHLHGLWSPRALLLAKAAHRAGTSYCVSPHGMLMPEAFRMKAWKKLPYWRFFEKAHLERAGLIHVTSELEAGSVRVRLPHVSIVVIPSGCSLEVPAVEPMFVQGVRHYVLFLGRLHPIKNLEKLIPAAASLPDGWALVVAGEGTPQYEERLRAAAARLAHGKVRFLGWLDAQEKFRALRGAAALVLPSLSENFGNVVLEALAVGTPVIASTGTPWSLLEPEGAGLWVPPETNALAAAMAQVWGDEAAWSGKRRNAARLAERFSWPSLAKQMVAAYETLDHRRETSSP